MTNASSAASVCAGRRHERTRWNRAWRPYVVTKYRYTVTHDGVVTADTPAEAEALALAEVEDGLGGIVAVAVEVEELGRGESDV